MTAARHADRVDPTAVPAAQVRQLPTNGDAMMAEAPNTVVPSENETMNSASTDTYNAEDYEWKDDHLSLKAAWQRTWPHIATLLHSFRLRLVRR